MNTLCRVSKTIFLATIFVAASILTACSPAQNSPDIQLDAIDEIRKPLELPELPLDFVETTGMINSPSGDLEVAVYQDSEGRKYSVNSETNQVVEIDARAILSKISSDAESVPPADLEKKAIEYAKATLTGFDSLQSSLEYESGEKRDNYFFTWYGEMSPGDMNRPFVQIGLHKSGILFAYYNTISLGE